MCAPVLYRGVYCCVSAVVHWQGFGSNPRVGFGLNPEVLRLWCITHVV
jgi:hypothetical protein